MQDLRVIGVENGALLVVSDDGVRFRIAIDEVLHSRIRQSSPEPGSGRKITPREIQSHIRAGMSAADVAAVTGGSLEYIQKFEGPILAEREFVVDTALAVPVITAHEADPFTQGMTFGAAITHRLHALNAINVRWASWKEEGSSWVVKLSFTADHIDHDARWSFEPRKHALSPINNEAETLSQQGELPGVMIPRLRAVSPEGRQPDASRFDSGAFDVTSFGSPDGSDASVHSVDTKSSDASHGTEPSRLSGGTAARETNQTADLLEALRRRRGEREAAIFGQDDNDEQSTVPDSQAPQGIRLVDVPLDAYLDKADKPRATMPQPTVVGKGRKGRASMPSWDDIVFGARPDDDPA
ncbi:MAG: septation protein SepH [Microbacteriaceae bacterium]